MQFKKKRNQLKEGLKADKKLKKSFYYFIYEKHIDWAILVSVFFLLLPCIASKNWYFLITKLAIFIVVIYFIAKYLINWHSLDEYYKAQVKLKENVKKLINEKKMDEAGDMMEKLQIELQKLPEKAEQKKHMYKDFMEYLKYDKIDFIEIEEILNKDKEATKTSIGLIISIVSSIFILREIPKEEYRNYRRILIILALTVLFFVLYTIDFWQTK